MRGVQKMDVIEMLSELEEIIEKGFEIPIVKKTFIFFIRLFPYRFTMFSKYS